MFTQQHLLQLARTPMPFGKYQGRMLIDLPEEYLNLLSVGEPREKVVCDYVGAMTDRFAIAVYEDIYIPKSWQR